LVVERAGRVIVAVRVTVNTPPASRSRLSATRKAPSAVTTRLGRHVEVFEIIDGLKAPGVRMEGVIREANQFHPKVASDEAPNRMIGAANALPEAIGRRVGHRPAKRCGSLGVLAIAMILNTETGWRLPRSFGAPTEEEIASAVQAISKCTLLAALATPPDDGNTLLLLHLRNVPRLRAHPFQPCADTGIGAELKAAVVRCVRVGVERNISDRVAPGG
jgi:hypothetical protein